MNKAVKLALGKYLIFLGSDDLLTVDLSLLTPVLTDPNTIYYGYVRTDTGKPSGPFNSWMLAVSTIKHQSMFYPIVAFQTDRYSTDYKICGDWEFNFRCWANNQLRFQYIPHEIAYFSMTGLSSRVPDNAFLRDRLRLVRKYLPFHAYIYASVRSQVKKLFRR